ncbi:MAG: ERCC4 domain-containing protein [Clostridia bacterium]|nr:ERCC4 domain-containing protein [Clostridia bacterium]
MVILRDTREQDTTRARRRYQAFGLPCRKAVLDYGDYTYNATISDKTIFDEGDRIRPLCAIERKMNLDELAGCFTRERKRFEAEMKRCQANGGRMYLLVENATWELLLLGRYRSRFRPNAFVASLTAWMVRYDLQVVFCKEDTSPRIIREILYRDLKERLETGAFDGG